MIGYVYSVDECLELLHLSMPRSTCPYASSGADWQPPAPRVRLSPHFHSRLVCSVLALFMLLGCRSVLLMHARDATQRALAALHVNITWSTSPPALHLACHRSKKNLTPFFSTTIPISLSSPPMFTAPPPPPPRCGPLSCGAQNTDPPPPGRPAV
jgi:hypothetical protein